MTVPHEVLEDCETAIEISVGGQRVRIIKLPSGRVASSLLPYGDYATVEALVEGLVTAHPDFRHLR